MQQPITLKHVTVHNLKGVSLTLQPEQLIVFTGVSGSGKSSLAFDTLYIEGQRRYVESLSSHAKRQMQEMSKPELESATGVTPTISIEQKTAGRNPRSTVGTMTEIYDFLRVLYARLGTPHCPVSGEVVSPQSRERIIKIVQALPEDSKLIILAPFAKEKKGEFKEEFHELVRKGFMRIRLDGKICDLSEEISLDKQVTHTIDVVVDRVVVSKENHSRLAESLTQALELGKGVVSILENENEHFFSEHAYSPKSGLYYSALEPHNFSFNSPQGMCDTCAGMGKTNAFNLEQIIDPNLSVAKDCFSVGSSYKTVRYGNIYNNLARLYKFSVNTPWKKLTKSAQEVMLHGTKKKWTRMRFTHPVTGAKWTDYVQWKGVLHEAYTRYTEAKSDSYRKKMEKLMCEQTCPTCLGNRLKPYPAATTFHKRTLAELTALPLSDCLAFFNTVKLAEKELLIGQELLKEIRARLSFLVDVGLPYLTLNRTAPTLSGGEAQRVRLASQIGCGLVGITYILDEPSIGLHPRDNSKLITTLKQLRAIGNTVIVVEHDEETILAADEVVDFGPGPGTRGGDIVFQGPLDKFLQAETLTAHYLRGEKEIPLPKKRRRPKKEKLSIKGATHHNLKAKTVNIPLGCFVAVTGVSGSGKSSLITETLYPALSNILNKSDLIVGAHKKMEGIEHLDKVIAIDQAPIGRNPRSNPSTYVKVFDAIRDLFSQLPEARARGYLPGRFSFNVKEGSCPHCSGMGMVRIEMDFLEDEWITCTLCGGKRFDKETLSVYYKGKTIYDVLEMEIEEAAAFFENIPQIYKKLTTLQEVGLGYLKLGQSSTTLSGGEAQRVKLAKELSRPDTSNTLYILDEPTTGLHFHDIQQLLYVLHKLVDRGNSVLVIEHNMEVIKTADWILDLGPEGGEGGGELIATAPPEKVAKQGTPTGRALKEALDPKRKKRLKTLLPKQRAEATAITTISVEGAQQHNLKHLDLKIPRNQLTIFTGPSGSGKSSLAFDTIYAEGQRRYIESLSPYARQFVKQCPKPKVNRVEGLSPAIAIEQKIHAGNPRSTIGTMTEIYDYLRLLFARIGIPHCPETGERIRAIGKESVAEKVLTWDEGERIQILAPIPLKKNEPFSDVITRLRRQGFIRIRLNDQFYDIDEESDEIPFDKKRKNTLYLIIDRLVINQTIQMRLLEGIEAAAQIGEGKLLILKGDKEQQFNLSFSVPSTGRSYPEITPKTFGFNTLEGMCLECQGLGYQYGANLVSNGELMHKSVGELLQLLWSNVKNRFAINLLQQFLTQEGIDPFTPLHALPKKPLHILMNGSDNWIELPSGLRLNWVGINTVLAKAGKSARRPIREAVIPLLEEVTCSSCEGARINPLARHVTISKMSLPNFCQLPISHAYAFIKKLKKEQETPLLQEVKQQLEKRLHFLEDVGLGYLALNRRAPTLSGGEAQRIRLASQLGSSLAGVLYVLDEPTIGLHPRDNSRLHRTLDKLKALGNTLLMVEHDPQTIETANYLVDFGPKAGTHGGYITAKGTLEEVKENPHSLTGRYLSGKEQIPQPQKLRPLNKGKISIKNAHKHNLKGINLSIPCRALTCVTGVSGSGKSTLINQLLLPAVQQALPDLKQVKREGATICGLHNIDKVINIDQNPIGLTIRSNISTYTDALTPMRTFFASLPEGRLRGLQPKNFSFNHLRGMCRTCWGLGFKKVELHFLPAIRIMCDACHGMRLNPVSLEVTYKGKNLGQYLDSTVEEVRSAFEDHPRITRPLDTLIEVGLSYLNLGQTMQTLSGGEAQRIKLSRELAKRSTGNTLYLLDEPTTGLHAEDIKKLLKTLHTLVDKGNTMVIIEHNLDMIKNADYVIDLGPEAGEAGGELLFAGRPEALAKHPTSHTGKYL